MTDEHAYLRAHQPEEQVLSDNGGVYQSKKPLHFFVFLVVSLLAYQVALTPFR